MLRNAAIVSIALTLSIALSVAPGRAAECLGQIDNLTVQYDLPADESMAAALNPKGAPLLAPPPPGQLSNEVLTPPTTTPRGRPGAPHGMSGGVGSVLPQHNQLSQSQSKRLQSVLFQARAVEALGDEVQCFNLLNQAQAIIKERG